MLMEVHVKVVIQVVIPVMELIVINVLLGIIQMKVNVSLLDIVIALYMLEEQLKQVLVWFVNPDILHYGVAAINA